MRHLSTHPAQLYAESIRANSVLLIQVCMLCLTTVSLLMVLKLSHMHTHAATVLCMKVGERGQMGVS